MAVLGLKETGLGSGFMPTHGHLQEEQKSVAEAL